jgi:hypothetical protein
LIGAGVGGVGGGALGAWGGAVAGGALGTAILPGPGTAIGAGAGALIGGLGGGALGAGAGGAIGVGIQELNRHSGFSKLSNVKTNANLEAWLNSVPESFGKNYNVTSGQDSKHRAGSLHYIGRALDIQPKDRNNANAYSDLVASALNNSLTKKVNLEIPHNDLLQRRIIANLQRAGIQTRNNPRLSYDASHATGPHVHVTVNAPGASSADAHRIGLAAADGTRKALQRANQPRS